MPMYLYKSENGQTVVVLAKWSEVKEIDSKSEQERLEFVNNNKTDANVELTGKNYTRTLCAPSLMFKGDGWGCSRT